MNTIFKISTNDGAVFYDEVVFLRLRLHFDRYRKCSLHKIKVKIFKNAVLLQLRKYFQPNVSCKDEDEYRYEFDCHHSPGILLSTGYNIQLRVIDILLIFFFFRKNERNRSGRDFFWLCAFFGTVYKIWHSMSYGG